MMASDSGSQWVSPTAVMRHNTGTVELPWPAMSSFCQLSFSQMLRCSTSTVSSEITSCTTANQ